MTELKSFFEALNGFLLLKKVPWKTRNLGREVEPGFGESHWSGCGLWLS